MGLLKIKTKISIEYYLEGEKISPVKQEYVDGEVFAMAGTSDTHNRIAINTITALDSHLRNSPCELFSSEIKVPAAQNVFYYPDILVSGEEKPESPYFRNNRF
jgi:Uma2 family endonuclease